MSKDKGKDNDKGHSHSGDEHGHDHDHGHHHDHDHDHGHEHGPHHTDKPDSGPDAPVTSAAVEDASTQALSEALRSSFVIVKVIMVALIVIFFASGVFTVPPQEKAIVFRFGKPRGTGPEQLLGPGLHWAWPAPIEEVRRIPVGQIQTIRSSVGWYATDPVIEASGQEPPARARLTPGMDGYVLTSDANIIHLRASMQYQISDPVSYSFNFAVASNVVQNALDNALFYAAARFSVDNALREGTLRLKEKIVGRVEELVTAQKVGITLGAVTLDVKAPLYVKPSFDEVLAAQQEQSSTIFKAQGDARASLSTAQGEAKAILNRGESDRSRLIQLVSSEAKYFSDRLPEYQKNKELFQQRLLTETWQRILTNAQDKWLLPEGVPGDISELRLLLNREPAKPSITLTNQ